MKRTRRAFLTLGLGAASLAGLGSWIRWAAETSDGAPWPMRRWFEINGALWQRASDPTHLNRVSPPREVNEGEKPRINGDIGLESPTTPLSISVSWPDGESGATQTRIIDTATWAKLPRASETALFCCVEGWSEPVSYAGVRFADLIQALGLGRKPDGQLYRYVGLATPDEAYFVSLDIESMMHTQTFIVDEMNGAPLTAGNGAPVRLMIPIKYGIKSLKRVGRIAFSDDRPPDFWAQEGYDWHASL